MSKGTRLRSPTCSENYQHYDFAESRRSARTGSSAGERAEGLLEGSDIPRVPLGVSKERIDIGGITFSKIPLVTV